MANNIGKKTVSGVISIECYQLLRDISKIFKISICEIVTKAVLQFITESRELIEMENKIKIVMEKAKRCDIVLSSEIARFIVAEYVTDSDEYKERILNKKDDQKAAFFILNQ